MKISRVLAQVWLGFLFLVIVGTSLVDLPGAHKPQPESMSQSPSVNHWFGTDSLGRDLFARTLEGTTISIGIGVLSTMLAAALALLWGGTSGLWGGTWDRWAMRISDIFCSLPSFVLVTVFCLLLQPRGASAYQAYQNFFVVALAIGFTHWFVLSRIVRALVIKCKVEPYVDAARALGAGRFRTLWRHIIPNIRPQLITIFVMQIPSNIMYESLLSFVGLGTQSPQSSWGLLIQEGWRSMALSPHLILFPAFFLFLTVWAVQVLSRESV